MFYLFRKSIGKIPVALLLLLIATGFFSSCATAPPIRPVENWFSVLPDGGDVYFYVNNRNVNELVESVLKDGGLWDSDIKFILSKTDKIYGVLFLREEPERSSFSVVTLGQYPKFFMDLNLSFNKNWKKRGRGNWYWFNEKKEMGFVIPSDYIIAISKDKMEELLTDLKAAKFRTYPPDLSRDMDKSDIFVFFPSFSEAKSLRRYTEKIKIPVSDMWVSLRKNSNGYITGIVFVFSSEKHAKLFAFVFRLVLTAWLRDVKEKDIAQKLKKIKVNIRGKSMVVSNLLLDNRTVDNVFAGVGKNMKGKEKE